MNLVFSGLEHGLTLAPGVATVLEVHNGALFCRLWRSLVSAEGRYAVEPYTIWEGEREVKPSEAFIVAPNPFELPWTDKCLMGEVQRRIEAAYVDDEDLRLAVEGLNRDMASLLLSLGFQMNAAYGFRVEWNLKSYLKAFGFGAVDAGEGPLLDSLMEYLSLATDAGCSKVLLFVNLKTFLTENEIEKLYEQVFFSGRSVLLLENKYDGCRYGHEVKLVVDQHFLEEEIRGQAGCPSLTQEGFCSNGFGAVSI